MPTRSIFSTAFADYQSIAGETRPAATSIPVMVTIAVKQAADLSSRGERDCPSAPNFRDQWRPWSNARGSSWAFRTAADVRFRPGQPEQVIGQWPRCSPPRRNSSPSLLEDLSTAMSGPRRPRPGASSPLAWKIELADARGSGASAVLSIAPRVQVPEKLGEPHNQGRSLILSNLSR